MFGVVCGAADVAYLPGPRETYLDELRRPEGGPPGGPFDRAVRSVARRLGAEFSDHEWAEMGWAEASASCVEVWAELVRESADRVNAAGDHAKQARELLSGSVIRRVSSLGRWTAHDARAKVTIAASAKARARSKSA